MTLFGSGDPNVVSGGIAEALITTELGLVVAIPALLAHALMSRRVKSYFAQLENDAVHLSQLPIRAGEVWHDRNNIGVAGVRSTVGALLLSRERPVVIQADRRVTTDLLVRVMDEAKLAGATSLSIATTEQ